MKIKCQTGVEVNVEAASLENACLDGLNLHRAMLGLRMDMAKWKGAKFDEHTKWPTGFDPLILGAVSSEKNGDQ